MGMSPSYRSRGRTTHRRHAPCNLACDLAAGLSLANEGLRSSADPEGLARSYEAALLALAAEAAAFASVRLVVLGGVYPHNRYTPAAVSALRASNARLLSGSAYHVIDFLAATAASNGLWRDGFVFNAGHPNEVGHLAMSQAVPIDWFAPLWGRSACASSAVTA